jgi:hypothetical protein
MSDANVYANELKRFSGWCGNFCRHEERRGQLGSEIMPPLSTSNMFCAPDSEVVEEPVVCFPKKKHIPFHIG